MQKQTIPWSEAYVPYAAATAGWSATPKLGLLRSHRDVEKQRL